MTHTKTSLRPLLALSQHARQTDAITAEVLYTTDNSTVTWSLLNIVWQERLGLSGLSANQCN